jgi:hypothetical protein
MKNNPPAMALDDGLRNRELIRILVDRYYRQGVRADDMSSHWRQYSDLFRVEVDSGGGLAALEGIGFGELRWRSSGRRLIQNLCIGSHLLHLPQRRRLWALRPLLRRVCSDMGLDPTLDAFRQLCTLELLDRTISTTGLRAPRFLLIGDGFGVLGALLKAHWPEASLVMVDLGQSLCFQAFHCQKAHPASIHALSGTAEAAGADFVYCSSDTTASIASREFDVAVNVASMQEMTPATVASYFLMLRRQLRPPNLFYCCNREFKQLPDGQTSVFSEYPWVDADRVLLDEPCPWHQYHFTPRRTGRSLRIAGVPIPGVSYYDGVHRHRLAVLSTVRPS